MPSLRLMTFDGGSWRLKLICPESGCQPATQCASCAADLTDPDSKRCYDCKGAKPDQSSCWIQDWFYDCPEEYVQGSVEFPIDVEWDCDSPIFRIARPGTTLHTPDDHA